MKTTICGATDHTHRIHRACDLFFAFNVGKAFVRVSRRGVDL